MRKTEKDMRGDYGDLDFGRAVRGKYYTRYKAGTNLVLLDAEVAEAFPTPRAVNEALRGLLELAKKTSPHKRVSVKK